MEAIQSGVLSSNKKTARRQRALQRLEAQYAALEKKYNEALLLKKKQAEYDAECKKKKLPSKSILTREEEYCTSDAVLTQVLKALTRMGLEAATLRERIK